MDSQWLNTQFELNPGKSKAGLAKMLGLEPPAVSKILKGNRQIKAQEYAAMRRYFGLPVDGERALKNQSGGYVLKTLIAGSGLKDVGKKENGDEWVIPAGIIAQRTQTTSDKIQIFEVAENTMEPTYKKGEHVLVDLSEKTPSPPGVFVVSDGFGYLVRQCEYVPGSDPVKIKVSANNESFQPQILSKGEFKIIGRVIAKLQWL